MRNWIFLRLRPKQPRLWTRREQYVSMRIRSKISAVHQRMVDGPRAVTGELACWTTVANSQGRAWPYKLSCEVPSWHLARFEREAVRDRHCATLVSRLLSVTTFATRLIA
jgi:hypothetical protein